LGIEKFGLVNFAQVIALYIVIFSEYGFNLSATKEVSQNRDNPTKLQEIFNAVITSRLILSSIGFLAMLILVLAIESLRSHFLLFILSSTMFFGQSIVPVWFFLGMEKMKFITVLNLISKIIFTLFTFIVIQNESDYIYTNMLHGLGSIVAGIVALFMTKRIFNIKFGFSNLTEVHKTLKEGFFIFISNFATNIYMNINIVILQFVASAEIVGLYSIAEKVFIASKHLISTIFQTVYPFACKMYLESMKKFVTFYIKFTYLSALFFLVLGLIIYHYSDYIIFILSSESNKYAIDILRNLAFVPVIIGANIAAYQATLIFNYRKGFTIVMISASILNIVANIILAKKYAAHGTVLTIIITELYVFLALNIFIYIKTNIVFFVKLKVKHFNNYKNA
jgi:PST family polysaccharide transporter